jgi:hypothetical protein
VSFRRNEGTGEIVYLALRRREVMRGCLREGFMEWNLVSMNSWRPRDEDFVCAIV